MRILITGGCGFVGAHCVEEVLKETDWEVVILDSLNYAGNLKRIADIKDVDLGRVKFVWHDLRAPISETKVKEIGDIDYVWHLAAESHVDRSLEDSIPFVMSNVVGTAHLLEYIKTHPVKKYIQFSTDEVYGPASPNTFFKEWDRLKPSNPYAAAKAGGDMLAYSFAHAFKLPIIITRSMNIFGERQHPEKFIPKTIRAILKGKPVVLHGIKESKGFILSSRCWIHARSVASALLFLLKKSQSGEIYNIVGEERDVGYIANMAFSIINGRSMEMKDKKILDAHSQRPGHDLRYALDGTKLREMGWKPKNIDQSFNKMVRWMVDNPQWLNL